MNEAVSDRANDVADAEALNRVQDRDSLFLMANLRRTGRSDVIQVRVRNLSAGGLMAELPRPIDANAAIEIEVRGIGWIPGRIAWQTEGRAGIAFDAFIDPQLARKPVGKDKRETGFGKPVHARR